METQLQTNTIGNFWEIRQRTVCPLCEGIGFQLLENHGHHVARKCRCISADRITALQKRSGIPSSDWMTGLNGSPAQSLHEAALQNRLKSLLLKRDTPAMFAWIAPSPLYDVTQILLSFANDLIRLQGYSCLWLDCEILSTLAARTNPAHLDLFDSNLAKSGDFLFVSNYQAGQLKAKLQAWLEDSLRFRLLHRKSILLVGPRPEGIAGLQSLFSAPDLGTSLWKKIEDFDAGEDSVLAAQSGWLF